MLLIFTSVTNIYYLISDAIEIRVEKTADSLTFFVVDTEKYELENVVCRSIKNIEIDGDDPKSW